MSIAVSAVVDPFLFQPFHEITPDRTVLAVVGLGYVGLPLAVALSLRGWKVIGYDVNADRAHEVAAGEDRTGEVNPADLRLALSKGFRATTDPDLLSGAEVFLVCVPTPITEDRRPDLRPLLAACATLGPRIRPGRVVVFESTVYPGVTEDICGPALETTSGLVLRRDFLLGYSPERMNPGDRAHRVENITKVLAAQTPALSEALAKLYGCLNGGAIHIAPSIRVAEAAKAIENAQRDINIAFVNEIALICERLGLSVHDVLAAARTKWNFLDFRPGLVGGHCIGVDPYYLSHASQQVGYEPEIILAGRRLNDRMADELADRVAFRFREFTDAPARPSALVLGATFKENVPDSRNAKTAQFVRRLARHGFTVAIHDPLVDVSEICREISAVPHAELPDPRGFNLVVLLVPHQTYIDNLRPSCWTETFFADPKGALHSKARPDAYWTL